MKGKHIYNTAISFLQEGYANISVFLCTERTNKCNFHNEGECMRCGNHVTILQKRKQLITLIGTYTLRQKLSTALYVFRYIVFTSIQLKHFLKDYTKGSKITNLRSIYHPERRDYDEAKMGFKTGAGKT
jgi:hypothetical protein